MLNDLPGKRTKIILLFLILHSSTAFWTLVDYDGYSISSKGFLPTVVDIWTWVWVNSGRWWWTGRPGVLRFMGSERVGHDWATELNWTELNSPIPVHFSSLISKMSVFTHAISWLTTSNLLWFLGLTFQVPMQYCSLQHQTLLPSLVTSTTGYCFCFGSIPSFFLELFLHWSPAAYWAPNDLGSSSFSILSFCLFILFMGFWRQEYRSGLPFPSPVDHILSDLSTMTHPSWVAPHSMA